MARCAAPEAAAAALNGVVRVTPLPIAFVISSLDTGGAETMLFKLLERLDRARFAPTVISLTTAGAFGPRLSAIGIPVTALDMPRGLPSPADFVRLVQALRRARPALVHTWMYHADLLGGAAARLLGIRRVLWGIRHSDLSPEHNKASTLRVVRICARLSGWLPAHILCCSKRAREIHVAAGYDAGKFTILPNGFELERFRPSAEGREAVRRELGIPEAAPVVGHVGRLHPQKNHIGLIEAARRIRDARPDARFVFAGAGVEPTNPSFWDLVEANGLADCVQALGRRDDVPNLMAAFDVLASPSHGEGFPNVVGEAMSCGVPCVVTDVGDCAELVGSTGRVVAPGAMQALAAEVVGLLALPLAERAALGAMARDRVARHYEIGAIVQAHERFYGAAAGIE